MTRDDEIRMQLAYSKVLLQFVEEIVTEALEHPDDELAVVIGRVMRRHDHY